MAACVGARFTCSVAGSIGCVTIWGRYDFALARSSFLQLRGDPALQSTEATLCDLTDAEVAFDPGDATRLALFAQKMLPVSQGACRVAVVGSHHTVQVVFELFTNSLLRDSLDFRYFHDISAATQWLQRMIDGDRDPLEQIENPIAIEPDIESNLVRRKCVGSLS